MDEIIYFVVVFDDEDYEICKIPVPFLQWARELCQKIDECKHYNASIVMK